jgi:hypothetical protein
MWLGADLIDARTEVERLRRGLEKVQERYYLATWAPYGGDWPTEYARAWHDGFVTAMATCSLIADEHLDPAAWAEHEEDQWVAAQGTDREWFERTGYCGHCGSRAEHCACTEDDPCSCGPHELSDRPLPCGWCDGTGEVSPRRTANA